jgi:hypothetical protein
VSSPAGLRWQPSASGWLIASGRSNGPAAALGASSAKARTAAVGARRSVGSSSLPILGRYPRRVRRVVIGGLALLVLAGCGGGGGAERRREEPRGEQEREQAERQQSLKGVPAADQTAFYQLATATGLLREHGALASLSRRQRPQMRAELSAAAGRVDTLRPRAAGLTRLRARLAPQLRAALAAPARGVAARRAGRSELAAANRITRGLDRFIRQDPRFAALVPD